MVVVLVGDVESLLAVEGHCDRLNELAEAKLAEVVLVKVADAYPDGVSPADVAPVEDEDAAVLSVRGVVWVGEASTVGAVVDEPDGL